MARRRRRKGLVLALLAGFVPGVLMTSTMAHVLRRGIYHHRCQQSVMELRRQLRSIQHELIEHVSRTARKQTVRTQTVRKQDDPVPVTVERATDQNTIRRVGPGRYLVDRRGAARILNNPVSLGQARVVPVQRRGRLLGFKVYRIRPKSPYHRLGLRNGDIIRQVNGVVITTPKQAIKLYNRIRRASRITLQVLRKGQPRTLRYWITEA